ncbi:MAG TPA: SDR family NAD(P)-dependent oxidoreductase [Solirubrobacterales bacterium]|nr:SDR family NAD(P)-dependent oxidoreductase [Solirubrobacterales bacterium]
MRLDGKVAAVTGGGSGIGEATCVRLAEEGAKVAVLDIDEGAAALTAKLAGEGVAIPCDVTDSGAVDAALARLEAELGPVDIWVNNAGIAGGEESENTNPRAEAQLAELAESGEIRTPLEGLVRMSDEDWRRMLSVHLDGTFHGTRAAARSMAARETGAIVNVASICGIEGCTGHPHYSAAKGGILAFTRTVAKELIQQNVRVNAVAPGFVDTQLVGGSLTPPLIEMVRVQTPQGRLGRPDEIAATIAFLASDDASFFVGDTVSPNGGFVTS